MKKNDENPVIQKIRKRNKGVSELVPDVIPGQKEDQTKSKAMILSIEKRFNRGILLAASHSGKKQEYKRTVCNQGRGSKISVLAGILLQKQLDHRQNSDGLQTRRDKA